MLGRLFERGGAPVAAPSNLTAWGDWSPGSLSLSGEPVTVDTASQLLAVYGSVTLIAEQVATMPLDVYRRRPDGAAEEVAKPRWLTSPTVDLTFTDWCVQVLWSLLMVGNAYVVVLRSGDTILELVPLDPEAVRVRRSVTGRPVYVVNGVQFVGEMLHIKGVMEAGALVGMSPLDAARQSIGLGLAAQAYGSHFFAADGNMPGVIEIPGKADAGAMRAMAEAWQRRRSKGGKGLPGVLDGGAQWRATGVTNEQAQFLATRQWTAAEIAGQVYKIDPSDLGIPVSGSTLTYANAQDRKRHRFELALSPWVRRVEEALSGLLAQPRYVRFNMDAYLRGDTAQRFAVYEVAERINASAAVRGDGPLLTTEEMRDLEDMPPVTAPAPPVAPSAAPVAEPAMSLNVPVSVGVNLPPSGVPDVHVSLPEQRAGDVHVTVPEPAVTVNVAPADVKVEAALPPPQPEARVVVRNVERDEHGRIARIVEEF